MSSTCQEIAQEIAETGEPAAVYKHITVVNVGEVGKLASVVGSIRRRRLCDIAELDRFHVLLQSIVTIPTLVKPIYHMPAYGREMEQVGIFLEDIGAFVKRVSQEHLVMGPDGPVWESVCLKSSVRDEFTIMEFIFQADVVVTLRAEERLSKVQPNRAKWNPGEDLCRYEWSKLARELLRALRNDLAQCLLRAGFPARGPMRRDPDEVVVRELIDRIDEFINGLATAVDPLYPLCPQ